MGGREESEKEEPQTAWALGRRSDDNSNQIGRVPSHPLLKTQPKPSF